MTRDHVTARRAGATALAFLALAFAGPGVHAAQAEPNTGGAVGCALPDGTKAKPGEYKTVVIFEIKGGRKSGLSQRWICGEDGDWHLVDEVVASVTVHWTGTKWRATGTKWHISRVAVPRSAKRRR
jgi:hypothetical protein